MSTCSLPECDRPRRAGGFCQGHYDKNRVHGNPRAGAPLGLRQRQGGKTCSEPGCDTPAASRGLCSRHHRAAIRDGRITPIGGRTKAPRTPEETAAFFYANVDQNGPVPASRPDLGPCWVWQRKPSKNGYGQLWTGEAHASAHVYSYELHVGPVPEGLDLDHLCHEPSTCPVPPRDCPHRQCTSPRHLQPTMPVENRRRGRLTRPSNGANYRDRDRCIRGHLFSEHGHWNGRQRICRACVRERAARRRAVANPDSRGAAKDRTRCPHGHPYDEQNTGYIKRTGERVCRACRRDASRRSHAKKRGLPEPSRTPPW